MDLSTTYLGLSLKHPFMPGASPLVDDLDKVRRLEDAGASAIVMHSLFEEQVAAEQLSALAHLDGPGESFAEAVSYFPETPIFALGPDEYLEQIARIKRAVDLPVIGSLNGVSASGWLRYARRIAEAGADALELNVYDVPADPAEDAAVVEERVLAVVRAVRAEVSIPLAVKLSPFYSALPHFVGRLQEAGASGVVLFNRLYQPDLDIEELGVVRQIRLSTSSELPLRLRWLAILSAQQPDLSFACSGGVHDVRDAIKALMAGAHTVQLVSALLKRGPEYLTHILHGVRAWLEEHEYESLSGQVVGSMNLARCPDPRAYERANYVDLLQTWHVDT